MRRLVLNESVRVAGSVAGRDIAGQLKHSIDNLKLAFFDPEKGGVDYDGMRGSDAFKDYREATGDLVSLHLSKLMTRESRLAFWVNLYNALVVHAVIELKIKNSVREVRSFF